MDQPVRALRASSLELFFAACGAREYEVAYHALCATLHAVESLGDPAGCAEVEHLANECRETIDASGTGHKLSSQSAAIRGHESVFKQLAVMAAAARLRLKVDAKNETKRAPEGALQRESLKR